MKVLNFGSLNYDYVYSVDHIVIPGETLSAENRMVFCGGKGLNQSIAMARAGVEVYHAGMVGEDGDLLLDVCKTNNIDISLLKKVEGESGHTVIQVDKNAQNSILLFGGSNRKITKEYIEDVLSHFEKDDLLILQNEINELAYIIEKAYEIGMRIILNPSPMNQALHECDFTKISIFMVNEIEAKELTGETEPEEVLKVMREKYPNASIVMTLGKDGVFYGDADQTLKKDALKVNAVDTTAAGDTFTGYFVYGLTSGLAMEDILTICTKASSITVSRQGATDSIPFISELNL